VLACKVNGLQSVATFDGLKSEGVQQGRRRSFHVELVIFDDQDFLGGGVAINISRRNGRADSREGPDLLDLKSINRRFSTAVGRAAR